MDSTWSNRHVPFFGPAKEHSYWINNSFEISVLQKGLGFSNITSVIALLEKINEALQDFVEFEKGIG